MHRELGRIAVVALALALLLGARGVPAGPTQAPSTAPSAAPSSPSSPSPSALARARELFKEGLKHFEEGSYALALDKFQEVARIRLTAQVRFNIARCLEKLGRLVEALTEYEATEADAKAASMDSVAKTAAESANGLRPRIPRLTVKVDPSTATVKIDGATVDANKEILVDPGAHTVEASAPKRATVTKKITLTEKEVLKLSLVLAAK